MTAEPASVDRSCAGCAAELHGPFCCRCGRAAVQSSSQGGLAFLTRDAMAEALSLEGRTLHTLRDLLWRPGGCWKDTGAGGRGTTTSRRSSCCWS